MKKKLLSLSLALFSFSTLFAKLVPEPAAEAIAKKIYAERRLAYDGLVISPVFSETEVLSRSGQPLIYVFDVANNGGFVMIAAHDMVQPVLAYTFSGGYDAGAEQPAFADWIENYKDQIAFCIERNLPSTPEIDKAWKLCAAKTQVTSQSIAAVGPYLTTKWNQGCYYNEQCPTETGGACGRVYTGCGATAMAQMMKYHKHPATGTGSHSYTWKSNTLTANFGATTYNWSAMTNSLSSSNASVAQLMYHSGVALDMNYGVTGSYCFFNMGTVMPQYFKYANTAQNWSKLFVTNDTTYQTRIAAELDSLRPVFYKGSGSNGQHFFICDGYQASYPYHFHFNWGWGGLYDGYYYCSALNPGSYSFTSGQGAVIRIMPQSITTSVPEEQVKGSVQIYPNPADDKVNIVVDELMEGAQVSVVNALGQVVLQQPVTSSRSLDTNGLSEGFYYVEVSDGTCRRMTRLVIAR